MMPADYKSAAAALSLAPDPVEADSPTASPAAQLGVDGHSPDGHYHDNEDSSGSAPSPPWSRSSRALASSRRRLSNPYSLNSRNSSRSNLQSFTSRALRTAHSLYRHALVLFNRLSFVQKIGVLVAVVVLFVLSILGLVYSHQIFSWLGPVAKGWRDLPGGWVIVWLLTFATAFPPMIGYSSSCTVAGFVYGFGTGWPIVATATVAGSTAAFLASRTVFSGYVHGLVGNDKRFVALGQVLRHDGLGVLALVRFCPLPYSLSNGFLATIPSIQPWAFAIATAIASPKLMVHVFIGSRLALLAENGDRMSAGDKAINYASMVVGAVVGMTVGIFIYKRTMSRAEELAREELEAGRQDSNTGGGNSSNEYADSEDDAALMMDPEDADAAALMDDDDISLWEAGGAGAGRGGRYRDDDEEAAVQGDGADGKDGQNGLAKQRP